MASGFLRFIHSQLFVKLPVPSTSYTGKTVVITGANVGLGKEAARHFAHLGASSIILAVRSLEKGEAAKADIETTTKCAKEVVKVWKLDMSSYASVIEFAMRVEKELERVDIAVLNAGIATQKFEIMELDESDITVNVVSTFLLAHLLLPKMKASANRFNTRPNLCIVASEVHEFAEFEERHAPAGGIFDRLRENNGKVNMNERYQVSKLLDVLCTRAMVERKSAEQVPVTINYVNPGLCYSELSREMGIQMRIVQFLLARTTEAGSRTLVHAASQGVESHGQYLSDCRVTPPSTWVLSKEGYEVQGRVWEELVEKLEKIQEGVTNNL